MTRCYYSNQWEVDTHVDGRGLQGSQWRKPGKPFIHRDIKTSAEDEFGGPGAVGQIMVGLLTFSPVVSCNGRDITVRRCI
jgi:hypothetical protein